MPGRKYEPLTPYRYGFNGKENDNEMKGEGNQQDYGMRIYDPRLGRFLSVDPVFKSFPWYTPYQFAGNKPILNLDLDGREDLYFMIPIWYSFKAKVNNEVASIGRLSTGQSGDASIPKEIQGHARNIMAVNQTARDVANAADYLSRPAKITAGIASFVIPEAGVINGIYNISKGNYFEGAFEIGGAFSGSVFRAFSFSEKAYVNGVIKTLDYNVDEAASLLNQGVRDFKELAPAIVESGSHSGNGGLVLERSVQKVMGEGYISVGEVTVPIKNVELLNSLNKSSKGAWIKVYQAGLHNGKKIETHFFRNNTTGQVFDVKTKYTYWHQKAFKKLSE